jgi:hypothetical protein
MTHDTWYMIHDTWHMTHATHDTLHYTLHIVIKVKYLHDTWHMTHDTWHMTYLIWRRAARPWGLQSFLTRTLPFFLGLERLLSITPPPMVPKSLGFNSRLLCLFLFLLLLLFAKLKSPVNSGIAVTFVRQSILFGTTMILESVKVHATDRRTLTEIRNTPIINALKKLIHEGMNELQKSREEKEVTNSRSLSPLT